MDYPQSLINLGDPTQTYVGGGNGSGSNLLSNLFSGSGSNPINSSPAGILGSLFGASSQASATNRYLGNQQTGNYNDQMLNAQANERNNNAADMKQLAQTSYILNGGSHYKPTPITINGKTYNTGDFGLGPTAPSTAQQQGSSSLQNTLLANLSKGGTLKNGSYVPTAPQTTPTTGEKIKSGLGGALTGAAAGTAIAPGVGTIIGGLLGGIGSLF